MTGEYLLVGSIALIGICIFMAVTFVVARRLDNYGIVDAAWAWSFTPLTLWYVLAFEGPILWQAVLMAMVGFWSLRLGTHLARRIAAAHPEEDRRYAELRESWGDRTTGRMFGFFELQGVFTLVLSVPLFLAAANPDPVLGRWGLAAIVIFVAALVGESTADRQLRRFKRETPDRSAVCQTGLWRYSRHPNYFFEWLIWVAFSVYALGSPYGWAGLVSPLIMLWLLLKVTGIPPTEEQAVKSKGDAYREYQRTTSAFFPWLRRS